MHPSPERISGPPIRRGLPSIGLALFALGAVGCADELGPVPFPTASVSGKVVSAGSPVGGGWLEFLPVEGTIGNFRSAPLGRDGSFSMDRAPVGRVAARLVHPPGNVLIPGAVRSFGSPVRFEVPESGASGVVIDAYSGKVEVPGRAP